MLKAGAVQDPFGTTAKISVADFTATGPYPDEPERLAIEYPGSGDWAIAPRQANVMLHNMHNLIDFKGIPPWCLQ
jgi:hypothetical protein